jgi:hypothetical protein
MNDAAAAFDSTITSWRASRPAAILSERPNHEPARVLLARSPK